MKIICSLATSLNGCVARMNGEEDFLSEENWDDYLNVTKELNNIIVGRKSYDLIKKLYYPRSFGDSSAEHKVIVSKNTQYDTPEGFVLANSPNKAIEYLKGKVDNALLIGGSSLNTSFAKLNLIDEFWLTVDPCIIGEGMNLFSPYSFDMKLKLIDVQKFTKDRLRVKYSVIR